jgi:RNA polymerase sigma-70 factor (ECF subfamily)
MDAEARFRELFRAGYPALRRYALNRWLSSADADDLVAATLEIAWRRIDDVPRDDPLPWLFAVARNQLRNKRRSDYRRDALIVKVSADMQSRDLVVAGPPDDAVVDADSLRSALDQLEDDDQELLRLVAWDGLSPSQAAGVIGCSSVAARSRLHRARNRLASLLGVDPRMQRSCASGQIKDDAAPSGAT